MDTRADLELIPGTEVVFTGSNGESVSHQRLVLIPRPSRNADDPLNWSKKWKTIVIFNQFIFVFVSILTPLSIAPLTQIFEAEFHKTLPQVNLLFGVAAIVLGYANFLIVPLANIYGRRPTMILCGTICVLANIWQALVTSFPSFIGARVISGLGAAANESIMPMVVADLFFVHQRGRSMALYFWAYFLGIFIGPIIAGSIAARINWRWFFWVCTILQAVSLLFVIFAHPETKYNRPSNSVGSGSAALRSNDDDDDDAAEKSNANAAMRKDDSPLHSSETAVKNAKATTTSSTDVAPDPLLDITNDDDDRPVGAPSHAQFSLIPKPRFSRGLGSVARDILSPLQILSYPIVLWASLSMGFAANCLLALNLTEAQVFAAPPYLFNPAQIGYVNFAFFVGAVVALLTAGPLSDWIALRKARKNGGVLEAEFRLLSVVPYVVACLVGMVIAGVGYQRGWKWEVIVIVGFGLTGVQVVGIPAVVISYAVDSYKTLPGEIMIAATVVKNSFGFAMVFFYNDWAARQGFVAPVLTLMAITVGLSLLGLIVFIPYGKKFRRATKDSSLHAL